MSVFDVHYGSQVTGSAEMIRSGLYYRIICRCSPTDEIVKLVDLCENGEVTIGVCIPVGGGVGIDRRIPVKRLGTAQHDFRLISASEGVGNFCTLETGGVCDVLPELERAVMVRRGGAVGLVIRDRPYNHQ